MPLKKYTDEQRAELVRQALELMCDERLSMRQCATRLGVSSSMLCDWLISNEFVGQYTRARIIRADGHACEIDDYKRQCVRGEIPADVARVAIDASKWQASKMDAARYGDKQTTEIVGKDGGAIKIDSTMTASDATAAYLAGLK